MTEISPTDRACNQALAEHQKRQPTRAAADHASPPGRGSRPIRGFPETQRQAERWDATRDHYAVAGLCDRCAAQAAYGHADGFGTVRPPCDQCSIVVAALPVRRVNGWRSFQRGDRAGEKCPSTGAGEDIPPASA